MIPSIQTGEDFVLKQARFHSLLKPLDLGIATGIHVLKKLKVYDPLRLGIVAQTQKFLGANLKKFYRLKVEGLKNLPAKGGFILVANHQSLLDQQILSTAIPRKLCFLTKSNSIEPSLLRHWVEFSGSMLVPRGKDEQGMEEAIDRLNKGEVLCLFPEGTIPGIELPRSAIEKTTGLLRGKPEALLLAIKAGVPIVPVGISGTGKILPPEVYPHMEIPPPLKRGSVRLKVGKPLLLKKPSGKDLSPEETRTLTKKMMKAISTLVDSQQNYIPMKLPLSELPQYEKLGVLIIHGFTSHLKTIEGIRPYLEKHHLKYKFPVLRGHGTVFKDLNGVSHRDWYADAEKALLELSNSVDRVVVVGLSMGGLVSLELAMNHPDKIAAVVTVGAALKFADPLAPLTPILSRLVPYWPSPNAFQDKTKAKNNRNYKWFPTSAFRSLYEYSQKVEKDLSKVQVPILVIHSKKDQVISPRSANIIYEKVSSPQREIKWFYKSGHEMMQDLEAEEVFQTVMGYILRFSKKTEEKISPPSVTH